MKKASLLVAAAFVALLPSLPNLQLTKDYSQYTTRGEVLLEKETENADSGLDTDYILEYSHLEVVCIDVHSKEKCGHPCTAPHVVPQGINNSSEHTWH